MVDSIEDKEESMYETLIQKEISEKLQKQNFKK